MSFEKCSPQLLTKKYEDSKSALEIWEHLNFSEKPRHEQQSSKDYVTVLFQ